MLRLWGYTIQSHLVHSDKKFCFHCETASRLAIVSCCKQRNNLFIIYMFCYIYIVLLKSYFCESELSVSFKSRRFLRAICLFQKQNILHFNPTWMRKYFYYHLRDKFTFFHWFSHIFDGKGDLAG